MTAQFLEHQPHDPAILALTPPTIPNWSTSVEGYDGGIGVRAIEGGLRFAIAAWFNMNVGDVVRLYWGHDSIFVWSKTIDVGDLNLPVIGTLDAGHIVRGDVDPLFYSVIRISQAPEESTPRLKLLVKLDRPGGFDDDLATPGHSHFIKSIPQNIIDNGVGPDEAAAGVPITLQPYPFMRKNDRVRLAWGSQEQSVFVEQRHIDNPTANPLIVRIDKAKLEAAGDSDGVAVAFQVIDEVGNLPDERSPWSAITYIVVDLKQNRLDQPIVLEAHPVSNIIDLDVLGEKDVTVLVNTNGGAFKAGDVIAMTWNGSPAEGSPVMHGPIELPVDRAGVAVTFKVPNAKLKAIAKGRATVSYVLKSTGVADRPSKNTSISVEGDISRLQAPSVLQASGGELPPDSPRATISVPYYQGRRPGDLITINWLGTRADGGNTTFTIRVIVGSEPEGASIERDVPASQIAVLDGGSVKVQYVVANDDVNASSVRDSLPLNLIVGAAQAELEQPEVLEANGDVLPPENAPGGANVIAPFTGTVTGDIVGLRWVGTTSGAHPLYEIPLSSHTAGYPVPFLVSPQHIIPNLNGEVTVGYYVRSAGKPTRNSKVRTLSIGIAQPEWDAPQVLEAPAERLDPNIYQSGFTVRIDTSKMIIGDGIDLIIEGRAGEGSVRPERRYVDSLSYIDFPIAALITAANLGRSVRVGFDVVRSGGPSPSKPLTLQVGSLLLEKMPKPGLEGFDGEVMNIGSIKDTTRVICGKWPFQLYGAPVWLSYVETRTDSTVRTRDHLVGVPNNRIEGLEVLADVSWLRECQENSTVEVLLKVGLFQGAIVADAVACPERGYSVNVGLDDLTTFTDYNPNGWTFDSQLGTIKVSEGNYHFTGTGIFNTSITKHFSDTKIGERYELSFDYKSQKLLGIPMGAGAERWQVNFNQTPIWTHYSRIFYSSTGQGEETLKVFMTGVTDMMQIDNLRVRYAPTTNTESNNPPLTHN